MWPREKGGLSHPSDTLRGMNVRSIPRRPLEAALAALDQVGIQYTIVCSGPEPVCSTDTPVAA